MATPKELAFVKSGVTLEEEQLAGVLLEAIKASDGLTTINVKVDNNGFLLTTSALDGWTDKSTLIYDDNSGVAGSQNTTVDLDEDNPVRMFIDLRGRSNGLYDLTFIGGSTSDQAGVECIVRPACLDDSGDLMDPGTLGAGDGLTLLDSTDGDFSAGNVRINRSISELHKNQGTHIYHMHGPGLVLEFSGLAGDTNDLTLQLGGREQ